MRFLNFTSSSFSLANTRPRTTALIESLQKNSVVLAANAGGQTAGYYKYDPS